MSSTSKEFSNQQRRRKEIPNDDTSQQPLFLKNTYNMISNCPSDIAGWSEDGTSIVVKDADRLAAEIIPTVYKHNKFSSFVRQLNFYGFRKLRFESRCNYWEFKHPLFRRDDIASISLIKKSAHVQECTTENEMKDEVVNVKNQLSDLKKRVTELNQIVDNFSKLLLTQSSSLLALTAATQFSRDSNFYDNHTNSNQNQQWYTHLITADMTLTENEPNDKKRKLYFQQPQDQDQDQVPLLPNSDMNYLMAFHPTAIHSQFHSHHHQQQQQQEQQEPFHISMNSPFSSPLLASSSSSSFHSVSHVSFDSNSSLTSNIAADEVMEINGADNNINKHADNVNDDDDFNFDCLFGSEYEEERFNLNGNDVNMYNDNSSDHIIMNEDHMNVIESISTCFPSSSSSASSSSCSSFNLPVNDSNDENDTAKKMSDSMAKSMSERLNQFNQIVQVSDISAITNLLPVHLQERFIDQLALSMSEKLIVLQNPSSSSSSSSSMSSSSSSSSMSSSSSSSLSLSSPSSSLSISNEPPMIDTIVTGLSQSQATTSTTTTTPHVQENIKTHIHHDAITAISSSSSSSSSSERLILPKITIPLTATCNGKNCTPSSSFQRTPCADYHKMAVTYHNLAVSVPTTPIIHNDAATSTQHDIDTDDDGDDDCEIACEANSRCVDGNIEIDSSFIDNSSNVINNNSNDNNDDNNNDNSNKEAMKESTCSNKINTMMVSSEGICDTDISHLSSSHTIAKACYCLVECCSTVDDDNTSSSPSKLSSSSSSSSSSPTGGESCCQIRTNCCSISDDGTYCTVNDVVACCTLLDVSSSSSSSSSSSPTGGESCCQILTNCCTKSDDGTYCAVNDVVACCKLLDVSSSSSSSFCSIPSPSSSSSSAVSLTSLIVKYLCSLDTSANSNKSQSSQRHQPKACQSSYFPSSSSSSSSSFTCVNRVCSINNRLICCI